MKVASHRWQSNLRALLSRTFKVLGVRLSCSLACAAGALLFLAWLAGEVLEGETRAFDEAVRSFIHANALPLLTAIMRFVTLLGSTLWLVTLGLTVAILFLIMGWRSGVILFAVTMAGATALNIILKLSFARARPAAFFDTPLPSSYSFPSGHALLSLCFYGALATIITPHLSHSATRVGVWAATSLLVSLIGVSRIYLGVHYASDVLAGYAAALVWVIGVTSVDYVFRRHELKGGR